MIRDNDYPVAVHYLLFFQFVLHASIYRQAFLGSQTDYKSRPDCNAKRSSQFTLSFFGSWQFEMGIGRILKQQHVRHLDRASAKRRMVTLQLTNESTRT